MNKVVGLFGALAMMTAGLLMLLWWQPSPDERADPGLVHGIGIVFIACSVALVYAITRRR